MQTLLVLTIVLVSVTIGVGVYAVKRRISNQKTKVFLKLNLSGFALLLIAITVFMLSGNIASASEMATAVATGGDGLKYVGAALSTGLACVGAGIATGGASSAAIGAISEEPKLLGRTLIFVGLSEGIAIYGLIISILILN